MSQITENLRYMLLYYKYCMPAKGLVEAADW